MNTQQLINYEATLQFALGDVLRDLAILMHYSEQGRPPDAITCTLTLRHISTFQGHLCTLEQEVRVSCAMAQERCKESLQSFAEES